MRRGCSTTAGEPEVTRFLTSLAADRQVAASTRNQALSAILFLYGVVIGERLPWMNDIVRAQRPTRRPVVLAREYVRPLVSADVGAWEPCPGKQRAQRF